MSKVLQEEYTKIYSEAEAAQSEIDAIVVKSEMSDEDKQKFDALSADNEKRQNRLDQITKALEGRKKLASKAVENGTADFGYEPEGRKEHEAARSKETGKKFGADAIREAVNLFANGFDVRHFADITTGTANSIFLPEVVMPPIAPSRDHVLVRAGVVRKLTPDTGVRKYPVPTPGGGGRIDEDEDEGEVGEKSFAESFTVPADPFGSDVIYVSNTTIAAPGYDITTELLPMLQYDMILGQETDDITTLLTYADGTGDDANIVSTESVSGIDEEKALEWCDSLPTRWDNGSKAALASPELYAVLLNMANSSENELIYVEGGVVKVNSVPVYKAGLSAFGANNVVGILFNVDGVILRDATRNRLNTYTSDKRQDKKGFQVANDHGLGAAKSALSFLKCPAS